MKVTAVLVLLTLCSIAAANLLTQRHRRQNTNCFDEACQNFTNSIPECDSDDDTVACGDECTGAKCQFYTDNNYSVGCIDDLAAGCSLLAANVPDACVAQPGRHCLDAGYWNFRTSLPESCNVTTEISPVCSEDCAGKICSYYNSNGYPAECSMELATACNATDGAIPVGCGALGQQTVKGILPVILLIAAFLVL